MAEKQIGLKLDAELYESVTDVGKLNGESFREFVTIALEKELRSRLRRDDELRAVVEKMSAYRRGHPKSEAA